MLFVTFVVVLVITRMVSLGRSFLAIEFPLLAIILYGDRTPIILFGFTAGALILWRHHANLRPSSEGKSNR